MPLVPMTGMLQAAVSGGYAVGAFNIVNEPTARAVVICCEALSAPVILQTSVSTVRQIGIGALIGFLKPLAERATVPVAIHLDHCKDPNLAKACVDAGWSSVMIDTSHMPLMENIAITADVVRYASPKGVSVEGELGAIGGVEDDLIVGEDDARLADVGSSLRYVRETGIHAFAPAIGTAHGLYKGVPNLRFDRFSAIREAVSVPLVIHGGTGLSDETFRTLVGLGASKINISTALKLAYLDGIRSFLAEHPDASDPLKLDASAAGSVTQMAQAHILLFGADNKA